jgi:fructose-bisphosphate aldolase class II
VRNGVVKMNIDTDTQYAFTRSVAGYMFSNYDGVLKVDGSVGQQEALRPPRLGQGRRVGDGRRVGESTRQLGSAGQSISA